MPVSFGLPNDLSSATCPLDTILYFHYRGNVETKSAIGALAALAQETRLRIFRLLVEAGPDGLAAGTIVDSLGVAAATLSFHLKELVHAGLIAARQDGRFIYYSANFGQITDLLAFLARNCCARSDGDCR
jgi:DNA-binding transcriptional ArsR family regulator